MTAFVVLLLAQVAPMAPTPFPLVFEPFQKIVLPAPTPADAYTWHIVALPDAEGRTPQPASKATFDNGATCCIWAAPGRYVVTINALKIDWEKRTLTQTEDQLAFDVRGTTPPPPVVCPKCGKNPCVCPPPPPPNPDVASFVAWLKAVPATAYSKTKALAVADNYDAIASQAAATPDSWSRDTMVAATKQRNIDTLTVEGVAAWRDTFFQPLAVWQSQKGLQPSDVKGHVALWQKTAATLRAAAF